ncbi:peptidoglycan-associated lipoprotein Pal [Thermosulfurimonas dismutans]|uniref:Peptidoglycan-associated lipoprotein n=1 Tax=Thermosulfurimonas dismutans TaxID=999894 RepID=A0A179D2R9_9BACT|nr:peptidoglycan-associated lipoprotein Pal [Thermosulfurimonas dismutans]OAQ20374.1 Peptidoglycan-associated lipoprotein precursor [Thermosulfurimonas dismutans]
MKGLVIFLGLIFLLVGCAKKEVPVGPIPEEAPATEKVLPPEAISPQPEETETGKLSAIETSPEFTEESLEEAAHRAEKLPPEERWQIYGRSTPPLKAIFFDFDDYRIRKDMIERLKENARFLVAHPEYRVELQGNCDERGDRDYNLALGEKRALEVKRFLVNLGVAEDRLSTVSFGEERPLAPGHNERSWALNRRVDLVIIKETY